MTRARVESVAGLLKLLRQLRPVEREACCWKLYLAVLSARREVPLPQK